MTTTVDKGTVEEVSVLAPAPLDVRKPEADDQRLFSVTTILGTMDKPALLYWAAEQSAKAACRMAGTLAQRIEEDGEEAVVKHLRDARFRPEKGKRTAAEVGTAVHDACEHYAIHGTRPEVDPDVEPFLVQFEEWCQRFQPEYHAAEFTVYAPERGYAGTADANLGVQGVDFLTDYKSHQKPYDAKGNPSPIYPETALQLAAYGHAEFAAAWRPRRYEQFKRRYYLLGPDELEAKVPVPEWDMGLGISITAESCIAYPVVIDEEVYDMFLAVLDSARWTLGADALSKRVIGPPLVSEVKS
jgi:hypothetical protein